MTSDFPRRVGKGVLALCVLLMAACSVILDWSGYTGGGGGEADAGDDALVDANETGPAPGCGAATCSGCCASAIMCAPGSSSEACGQGGHQCQSCAGKGLVCTGGACVQPPPDSGPPAPCSTLQCKTLLPCLGQFEIACCKPDGSCGCSSPLVNSSVCM
jgi:hypothetical protein